MVNFFKELEKQEKKIIENYKLIKKVSDNFNNNLKTNYNSMDSECKRTFKEIKSEFKSLKSKLDSWYNKYKSYDYVPTDPTDPTVPTDPTDKTKKLPQNLKCKEDLKQILDTFNKGIKTNETENFLYDYFKDKKLLKENKTLPNGVTELDLFELNNIGELEKEVDITFKNDNKMSEGIKEIKINNEKSLSFLDKAAVCNVLYKKLKQINQLASDERQFVGKNYYVDINTNLIQAKKEIDNLRNRKLIMQYTAYEMCRAEDEWSDEGENEKQKQKKEDFLEAFVCDLMSKESKNLFYNSDLSKMEELEINTEAADYYKDDTGNDFIGKIKCNASEHLGLTRIITGSSNIQGINIPNFIYFIVGITIKKENIECILKNANGKVSEQVQPASKEEELEAIKEAIKEGGN